jgi:hypothetical protein
MTKLISLRLTVATDDAVELKELKPRLAAIIGAAGTETVGENGTGGRVHWGTVELLQGPEHVTMTRRSKRVAAAAGQPALPRT